MPPSRSKSRVWVRSYQKPTSRNNSADASPWATIMKTAAMVADCPASRITCGSRPASWAAWATPGAAAAAASASTTNPIWLTEE